MCLKTQIKLGLKINQMNNNESDVRIKIKIIGLQSQQWNQIKLNQIIDAHLRRDSNAAK